VCDINCYRIVADSATDACMDCPPGLICDGSSTAQAVVENSSWVPDGAIFRLQSCPNGFFVYPASIDAYNAALQKCLPCKKGEECTRSKCVTCSPRAADSYKTAVSTDACLKCPADTYRATPGVFSQLWLLFGAFMVLWDISRVLRITSNAKHVIVGGVEWLLRPFELDPNTHTFPRLVDLINTLAVALRMILGMKVKGKKMPGCPACFIILLLYLVTVQSFVAPLETSPEKDWKTVIENAPPGSKILMRGGIYTGFCNVNVPNNVVLKGESNTTSPVVIDCQSASRHFTVPSGSKCHLEDIALVNGRVNGDGGCILVDGGGAELSLVRVTLKNCKATGGGGAISLVSSTAKRHYRQ